MKSDIRLLIADDHPIVRQGLRQVIEADPSLKVIAEAGDGRAALEKIQTLQPEIAVLDIDMPGMDGFAVARALREQRLDTAVIFLTIHREEDFFNEALDVGARGYVLKDSATTDIASAVRAVARGEHYTSPALTSSLVNHRRRSADLRRQKPTLNDLTPAERRVLRLIADYKTSREIAAELCVSLRTIETHRTNICQKLDLRGSHALMKFALEHQDVD